MSTLLCPRPLHPFPYLISPVPPLPRKGSNLSHAQREVISRLSSGARVLFDIQAKRALIYTFRQGVQHFVELTVRALSGLVRAGWIVVTGREGRLVHYALASTASPR